MKLSTIVLAILTVTCWLQVRGQEPTDIDFQAELPRIPPSEPDQALTKFRVKEGFRIELAASEPLIRDPVAIDFDEYGRMFVVELPEYNQKFVRKETTDSGRIRVLTDTDDDGVFDHSEVYVDDLKYPSAVACYDGGVFVASAPEILYCKDTDGDGRSDLREIVYTGFGQEFQRAGQAQLNSFRWGLDNRFHVCTTFSGGAITRPSVSDSKTVNVRNRGFLFDPRTLEYEAGSGGGQHGLAIDDWGREFRCRNSDPIKLLVYDDRYLARNPYLQAPPPSVNILDTGKHTQLFRISPDEPWRVLRTRMRNEGLFAGDNEGGKPFGFFTAATGITIYRGDAWPEQYVGTALVGEVANNLIFRASLHNDGVTLTARRADEGAEFVASTDNWFRPVQFAGGPDGSLYVVDMYRELIEGASFLPPQVLKHLNVVGGVNRGRIYRIVPTDFQRRPSPRLGDATTQELVALLNHRNGWHRDTAARLLYTRQDRSAVAPLRRLVAEASLPQTRVHALYALDGLGSLDSVSMTTAIDDPDARVRRHAVRFAEQMAEDSAVRRRLIECANDPDVLVRFQVAFSLGALSGSDRDKAMFDLLERDGHDSWFRMAITNSVGRDQARVLAAMLDDQELRKGKAVQLILGELAMQIGVSGNLDAARSMARAVDQLYASDAALATQLLQRAAAAASSRDVADEISASSDLCSRILDRITTSAKNRAVDDRQSESSRVAAIRLLRLVHFDTAKAIADQLLDVQQSQTIQLAAINLLATFDDRDAGSTLLQRWSSYSPSLRSQVFEVISTREFWLDDFLQQVKAGEIGLGDVDPARIRILASHPSRSIARQVTELYTRSDQENDRATVVRAYQPALQLQGDPELGKEHFRRVCSACHRVERVGIAVGADLKAIRNRGMDSILLNILDPNREVKPQYLNYVVMTNDGRVHTGLIHSESANSITLRRPDNTSVTILRIDIDQMQSTGLSFMPEGLEEQLDVQAMADLLAYFNAID